jgi:thiamine transporter ThiT
VSEGDRAIIVAAILAVPWTTLAGLLWWNPSRPQGSSPWTRYTVYAIAASLTCIAVFGATAEGVFV